MASVDAKRHTFTPEEIKQALYDALRARLQAKGERRPTGYVQLELDVSADDDQLIVGARLWVTKRSWGKHPVKV